MIIQNGARGRLGIDLTEDDARSLASEIAYGGGSVKQRRARLEQLAESFPIVAVTAYFEILAMQEHARESRIREGIYRAFAQLREEYLRLGSWLYVGQRDADEGWGWIGPYAWSEADYQHRFASLLEQEFPRAVHLEMPINERMRSDLDALPADVKRRSAQYVDIVISDLSALAELPQTHDGAGAAFRSFEHEAFIEVKWYWKAAARWEWKDLRRFLRDVPADLTRLHAHLAAERCSVAAMLVVDDRGSFLPRLPSELRPDDVILLELSPPTG